MLSDLKKSLKKNKITLSAVRFVKNKRDDFFKFFNLNILKYISPSSKFFGPPKHELWNWDAVEEYVKRKQQKGDKRIFIKKLYEQQITFPPPIFTIGTPTPEAALEPKENFNYCEYVCMFPNARISIRNYNLITEDDYFVQPLSNYYDQKSRSHVLYNKLKLPGGEKLKGRTLFLKGGVDGYYHLMHDAICSIKLVQDAGINLDSIDNFLVYEYDDNWYHKVYSKLGLPRQKFVDGGARKVYECECLFITSYFEHHGNWYSNYLKEVFKPQLPSKYYKKKIFISRAKAPRRRIINEEEVTSFLSEKGFTIVFAEDLKLEEQVAVYQNAECIVALHGANLVNILFCKPGTKICEIRYFKHAMYYKKLYYEMALNCNLDYYLLYSSEGTLPEDGNIIETNVYVDLHDLNKMLLAMGYE